VSVWCVVGFKSEVYEWQLWRVVDLWWCVGAWLERVQELCGEENECPSRSVQNMYLWAPGPC